MGDIAGPVVFETGGKPEPGNTTMVEHEALRAAERQADTGPQCLFERIGGFDPTTQMVSGVYDKMKAHAELGPQFEKFAKTEATFKRLKDQTVLYLQGEWGGALYEGGDLYISHSTFGIPVAMFDAMMGMFRDTLHELQIVEPEFAEVMKSVEKMRGPMCDPGGTFAKEFNDRLEKLTKDRQERTKYYQKHGIPFSKVQGWALDKDNDPFKPNAKAKAKAKYEPTSGSTKFTMAEVQQNASSESLWIVVDKKVYNCTNYMKDHPGGAKILTGVAGKDATTDFHAAHKPSHPSVKSVMKRLLIGSLVDDEAPAKSKSTGPAKKRVDGDGKLTSKQTETGKTTEKANKSFNFGVDPELDCPPGELPASPKGMLLNAWPLWRQQLSG